MSYLSNRCNIPFATIQISYLMIQTLHILPRLCAATDVERGLYYIDCPTPTDAIYTKLNFKLIFFCFGLDKHFLHTLFTTTGAYYICSCTINVIFHNFKNTIAHRFVSTLNSLLSIYKTWSKAK